MLGDTRGDDRGRELRELQDWCAPAPGDAPEARWLRADPTASPSALLDAFEQRLPPNVRAVRFRVDPCRPSRSDRTAFVEAMIEQLAPMAPASLTPPMHPEVRAGFMLDLLEDVSDACIGRGERLVLIVDGLDRDRREGPRRSGPSIAGVLPPAAIPGLCVLVSSASDWRLPSDVPAEHPLRDPRAVRWVAAASDAPAAEAQLRSWSRGDPVLHQVLAVLAVAGGGLRVQDLRELLDPALPAASGGESQGAEADRVADIVDDGVRRGLFTTWSSNRRDQAPQEAESSYALLPDLAAVVLHDLGPAEVAVQGRRLTAWAERYRARGWPVQTPYHLLRGHFQWLDRADDLTSMIRFALDEARHGRMAQATGSHVDALAEVITTLQRLTDGDAVGRDANHRDGRDLATAVALARRRDRLMEQDSCALVELPAAQLGCFRWDDAHRALGSISPTHLRAQALATMVEARLKVDFPDAGPCAADLADQAYDLARSVADPGRRAVATAYAACGQYLARWDTAWPRVVQMGEEAMDDARAVLDPALRAATLVAVAERLVDARLPRQAEELLDEARADLAILNSPRARSVVLAGLARSQGRLKLTEQALETARSIPVRFIRAAALSDVLGYRDTEIEEAQAEALAVGNPYQRGVALIAVARGLMSRQRSDAESRAVACGLPDPTQRLAALAAIALEAVVAEELNVLGILAATAEPALIEDAVWGAAKACAGRGDVGQARAILERGAGMTPGDQDVALARMATELAQAGRLEPAVDVARCCGPDQRVTPLTTLAVEFVGAGRPERALALVREAESLLGSVQDPDERELALADTAVVLARVGRVDEAERIAATIPQLLRSSLSHRHLPFEVIRALAAGGRLAEATSRARALVDTRDRDRSFAAIVDRLGGAGRFAEARHLVDELGLDSGHAVEALAAALTRAERQEDAETLAESQPSPYHRQEARLGICTGLLRAGQLEEAERFALAEPVQSRALHRVIGELVSRGLVDRASALVHRIPRPDERGDAATVVSLALANAGRYPEAEQLVRGLTTAWSRDTATCALATHLAGQRQLDRARRLATAITNVDQRVRVLEAVIDALWTAGDARRVRQVAASACATLPWTSALHVALPHHPAVLEDLLAR